MSNFVCDNGHINKSAALHVNGNPGDAWECLTCGGSLQTSPAIEVLCETNELMEWFEKHCAWARRIDSNDKLSVTKWEVCVSTGIHTSMTFGSETLLGAIGTARGICEE